MKNVLILVVLFTTTAITSFAATRTTYYRQNNCMDNLTGRNTTVIVKETAPAFIPTMETLSTAVVRENDPQKQEKRVQELLDSCDLFRKKIVVEDF